MLCLSPDSGPTSTSVAVGEIEFAQQLNLNLGRPSCSNTNKIAPSRACLPFISFTLRLHLSDIDHSGHAPSSCGNIRDHTATPCLNHSHPSLAARRQLEMMAPATSARDLRGSLVDLEGTHGATHRRRRLRPHRYSQDQYQTRR